MTAIITTACRALCAAALLMAGAASAVVLNITTEFEADIKNPGHNEFRNTTPVSGFCQSFPSSCPAGVSSISIPGLSATKSLKYGSKNPEESFWLGIDGRPRDVELTHTKTGHKTTAQFRWAYFSQLYTPAAGSGGLSGGYPKGGCSYGANVWGDSREHHFMWKVNPEKAICQGTLKSDRSDGALTINDISLVYTLKTDKPLELPAGEYEGEVVYTVGNGADVDFSADSYTDSEVRIKITAKVEHAFYLKFPRDNMMTVQLTPPGGWGSWINGGMVPPKLSSEVPFTLTSSGSFKVAMTCEFAEGTGCGLKHTASGETVPLDVSMTIPGFVSGGQPVRGLRLDTTAPRVIDPPGYFAVDLRSKLDFAVGRAGVEKMIKVPGSDWKGVVTLVFDSDIN